MVPVLKISAIQVLALGGIGVALGIWLKKRVPVLDRLHIPAPIVGGMLFAILATALRDRVANFDVDTSVRDILLVTSFTAIGMNASLGILKKGGIAVLIMAALAVVGGVVQSLWGIAIASAFGLDPRVGILAGTVSLAGGPATSLAFGGMFEQAGVAGATTIALTSATFGIAVAGLISGWTGGRLIRKWNLRPVPANAEIPVAGDPSPATRNLGVLGHIILVTTAMGLGTLLHAAIAKTGFILPLFVSTLLMGVLIRNLDDRYRWFGISTGTVTQIVTVALSLFIAIAMVTLRLWELKALALPLFIILVSGIAITWLFCAVVAFRVLGKDYEAGVMTAGFTGFMVGITPNAMASMQELESKYGLAPRALLVVPLVGGFLIDVTNSVVITFLANLLR